MILIEESVHFAPLRFFVLALLMAMASGCEKDACLDESYCVQSCECTSQTSGASGQCDITFQCHEDNQCSDGFGELSCDAFCQRYAANETCGGKACVNDSECQRDLRCAFQVGAESFEEVCRAQTPCDTTLGVCAPDYYDDNALCALCVGSM